MKKPLPDSLPANMDSQLLKRLQSLQDQIRERLESNAPVDDLAAKSLNSRLPFLSSHLKRRFDKPYHGDVFIWDIDKTYLETHFSTIRGLAAIPFESAEDKRAIPGTVPLLRALRRGLYDLELPLFFISGSPPQLRPVIEEKMSIDGIDFDGSMFKDQWGLVRAGRVKDVKSQLGYKLSALLSLKMHIQGQPKFYCFGDDVESDAEVFSLFSEVMKGLTPNQLRERLEARQVHEEDIEAILSLLREPAMLESIRGYQDVEPVGGVFIHLDRGTDPKLLQNDLVKPTYSFLQTALLLVDLGCISVKTLSTVVHDIRVHEDGDDEHLKEQVLDAIDRFDLSAQLVKEALDI